MVDTRKQQVKKLEFFLRNYETYKTGIKNLQRQLDYIMPNITTSYDLVAGSNGTFNIKSDTEHYAIDRIESKRALILREEIERYNLIIDSINFALGTMEKTERDFVENRYFKKKNITQTARELGYSEKYIFNLKNGIMDKLLISLRGLLEL